LRTFFRLASLFTPKRWLGGLFIKFFVSLFVISGSSTVAIIGFGTWKSQVELKEALSEDKLHDRVAVEGRVVAELLQAAATPERCQALLELLVHRVFGSGVLTGKAGNSFSQSLGEGRLAALYRNEQGLQCHYPAKLTEPLQARMQTVSRQGNSIKVESDETRTASDIWFSTAVAQLSQEADRLVLGMEGFDPWKAFWADTSRQFGWLWPYMLISNCCTALLLAFFLLNRIRHAEQVANTWAQGQLDIRINDEGHDEFGRLAQRFDHMADAVAGVIEVKQAIAAQDERSRLARELHDTAKQRCFALGLQLSLLRRLCSTHPEQSKLANSSLKLVEHLQRDMSDVIHRLSAPTVAELGLDSALKQNLANLLEGSAIQWSVDIQEEVMHWLNEEDAVATELLLIASEGAANTLRHANASHLWISLVRQGERFVLKLEDDGQGFHPGHTSSGMGLGNMRQRAHWLSEGRIDIRSEPGQGTTVEISFKPTERQ